MSEGIQSSPSQRESISTSEAMGRPEGTVRPVGSIALKEGTPDTAVLDVDAAYTMAHIKDANNDPKNGGFKSVLKQNLLHGDGGSVRPIGPTGHARVRALQEEHGKDNVVLAKIYDAGGNELPPKFKEVFVREDDSEGPKAT